MQPILSIQQIPINQIIKESNTFYYESDFFYDVSIKSDIPGNQLQILFKKQPFSTPFIKNIIEPMYEPYKIEAEFFFTYHPHTHDRVGWLCLNKSEWNHTARVIDIDIARPYRRQGFGTQLIDFAIDRAREWKMRAVVLECQSSNYPAIQFYFKKGFQITGLDSIAYSNHDLARHEVRLELGLLL